MLKFLGIHEKRGKISHNVLSPLHKLLYNIARRFILPRNSKRSEVNLRDATLIYCMANHIKINFRSLMISHFSDSIDKKFVVGYGGLLTWIFRKFGVLIDGLHFPMGPNNKMGAKCLNNLHLKLNDNGILENALEKVNDNSDKEEETQKDEEEQKQKEEEVQEKEDQKHVPSATERAEASSPREQGEEGTEGEAVREDEEAEEANNENDDNDYRFRSSLLQHLGRVEGWLLREKDRLWFWMMTLPPTTPLSLSTTNLPHQSQPHHHPMKFHHHHHHLYHLHHHQFPLTLHPTMALITLLFLQLHYSLSS